MLLTVGAFDCSGLRKLAIIWHAFPREKTNGWRHLHR
jgi:hypothetical protein